MRYLGLGLYAEGPTDHRFLRPLLRRAVEEACLRGPTSQIEIGDVLELRPPRKFRDADRATQILESLRDAREDVELLFIHADGDGDPVVARERQVDSAGKRIQEELTSWTGRWVPVIPVREMEAWALVDGEALRRALGSSLSDDRLELPKKPAKCEKIEDPKLALRDVCGRALKRGRRIRRAPEEYLQLVAGQTRFELLIQVPSYREFDKALGNALAALRLVR